MINIHINDKPMTIDPHSTLAEVLTQQGYKHQHFAIAINREFVPRAEYANKTLNPDDRVEIVTPMQGG